MEGIRNNIFKKEHVEQLASERYQICSACDRIDLEGDHCLVKGTAPCCGNCGCNLTLKIRSLASECPEGKWESIMNHDEEYEFQKSLENE